MTPATPFLPGSVLGIVGGGQLGRMTALAAAASGYRCHVFASSPEEPAAQVAWRVTAGAFDDGAALATFAAECDVVTCEFEHLPPSSLAALEENGLLRPSARCLALSQHRVREKEFFRELGIDTVPWRAVRSVNEAEQALQETGAPGRLKTARCGYDGLGQRRVGAACEAAAAWRALGLSCGEEAVVEAEQEFVCEVSLVAARGVDGAMAFYDLARNDHVGGVLRFSHVPVSEGVFGGDDKAVAAALAAAGGLAAVTQGARAKARKIADALDLVGVLAVEFFLLADGRLLANEFAPRPHNSGHWTLDACNVSQFAQLARVVFGAPPAPLRRLHDAWMANLFSGDAALRKGWGEALIRPFALWSPPLVRRNEAACWNRLHVYGKSGGRKARKAGHVTFLA